jgi:1,2-diacylglycerol 3-alpha-glucosyltransferase
MKSLGILWAQYGPYHFARAAALQRLAHPVKVHALEIADCTRDYRWQRPAGSVNLTTICPNSVTEHLPFDTVFQHTRRQLAALGMEVCLLPSYSPRQSLAALLAARSLGVRTVMMNESHAGTARAGLLGTWVKRRLVGMFDAALVGGQPQKRYSASLGLSREKIFTGYDAVDNDYFAGRAAEVRAAAEKYRTEYALPPRYFLSLGRFVAKKNLVTLIRAYRRFLNTSSLKQTHLVMVGSGEDEPKLRALCQELNLPVFDHSSLPTPRSPLLTQNPGLHFYGFRQIDENPVFYALADAFVLPSLWEEWGLVVNEAMASGLPVVVSETAGCAEDLLDPVNPAGAGERSSFSRLAGMGLQDRIRENGLLFNPESSDELARALLLLESSPELRSSMAQVSQRIAGRFSCDNFARNALLAAQVALRSQPALQSRAASPQENF